MNFTALCASDELSMECALYSVSNQFYYCSFILVRRMKIISFQLIYVFIVMVPSHPPHPLLFHMQMLQETKTALEETKATQDGILQGTDTFFLLFGGALVFLMQAGFAMLCAGSVRAKNVKNILLKNMLDGCGGALGFFAIGFGFAYGGTGTFIGNEYFFLNKFDAYAEWFFQFAFAATAATIVAGTVAERCKMAAYLCYSVFLTGFVYPVIVRSIWSSAGFLTAFRSDPFLDIGMIDFAGSGVVHLTGGVSHTATPSFNYNNRRRSPHCSDSRKNLTSFLSALSDHGSHCCYYPGTPSRSIL